MATKEVTITLNHDEAALIGDALGILISQAKRSQTVHAKDSALVTAFKNKEQRVNQLILKIDSQASF